jgi:hypothetical protein
MTYFSKIPASRKKTQDCDEEAVRKLAYERQRRIDITSGFKELHMLLIEAGEEGAHSANQAAILATAIRFVRRTLEERQRSSAQEEEEERMSYECFQSPEVTAFFAQ